jgi:hypothetical protein
MRVNKKAKSHGRGKICKRDESEKLPGGGDDGCGWMIGSERRKEERHRVVMVW